MKSLRNIFASTNTISALNIYAWFYQRLFEEIAIQWDSQNCRFLHISEKRHLVKWAVNTFLGSVFTNGCCIYLIVKEFLSPKRLYLLELLVIQLVVIICGVFWFVVFISANLYGNNFVHAWNEIRNIILKTRKRFSGIKLVYE